MAGVDELLGREHVRMELPELTRDLAGRSVVITGAAGSIGSELSRQIALHDPAILVLVDRAETPLYYLDLELREAHPKLRIVSTVTDVADPSEVDDLFGQVAPDRVFHAAAYKHIPLMEVNPRQAIRNNVLGTANLTRTLGEAGSGKLILVSTDKAVNPRSVMGATKRVAELLVLYAQAVSPDVTFGAVRFGNVLRTSGSVVEVFERQLAKGKPLTITDAEVSRFFMTIDEAVRLLLRASILPSIHGSVAMLEMGDAVPIVEIARSMLRRAGLPFQLGETVVFTGLRPGEKLHEELVGQEEESVLSEMPGVSLIRPRRGSAEDLRTQLIDWLPLLSRDRETLDAITRLYPEVALRTAVGDGRSGRPHDYLPSAPGQAVG